MLQFRLRAYDHFLKRAMPTWTDGLDRIDFDKIVYYRKPSEREEKSWDDVPEQIKATFERLGIPEAERKFLAGVGAQYDSEVVYHSVREELTKIGVVFMGTDQALKEYPEIFKQHFGTDRPARGQQVRGAQQRGLVGWLVRLRAQGRRGPAAAPGLLPHQRREHRPVRADADRRRRGRARSTTSRAARPRSTRPTRSTPRSSRSSPCRAPRSATRPSRTGRTTSTTSSPSAPTPTRTRTVEWIDANTGSRKTVKYPSHLPARRGRHGGHHQRRGRRQGPAPGHRRQGDPPRAEHAIADRLASPSRRTAAGRPIAASSRSRRAPRTSWPASAATR